MEAVLCALLGMILGCSSGPTATPVPAVVSTVEASPTAVSTPTAVLTATVAPTATPTRTPGPRVIALPPPKGHGEIDKGPASAVAKKLVALTFDAGVTSQNSIPILDALKAAGVHSTMFVTGEWADRNPQLIQRIVADGHELANHSYNHPDFVNLSDASMIAEMQRAEDTLLRLTGKTSKPWFRPPYGSRNSRVAKVIGDQGYYNVYWSLDSWDWMEDTSAAVVLDRVLTKTVPGSIIVSHLTSRQSAEVLPRQIAGLRAQGYTLVTLSELFSEP